MTAGAPASGRGGRLVAPSAAGALLRRPDLWPAAVRLVATMIPGRRRPGWPAVPDAYARFRHQTMFGAGRAAGMDGAQLVDYLAWCRMMGAVSGSGKRSRRAMGRGRVWAVLTAPHSRRR